MNFRGGSARRSEVGEYKSKNRDNVAGSRFGRIQELVKLVTRLQEQVVRSLQTSFWEDQLSYFVKSSTFSSIVVCTDSVVYKLVSGRPNFRISKLFVISRTTF